MHLRVSHTAGRGVGGTTVYFLCCLLFKHLPFFHLTHLIMSTFCYYLSLFGIHSLYPSQLLPFFFYSFIFILEAYSKAEKIRDKYMCLIRSSSLLKYSAFLVWQRRCYCSPNNLHFSFSWLHLGSDLVTCSGQQNVGRNDLCHFDNGLSFPPSYT